LGKTTLVYAPVRLPVPDSAVVEIGGNPAVPLSNIAHLVPKAATVSTVTVANVTADRINRCATEAEAKAVVATAPKIEIVDSPVGRVGDSYVIEIYFKKQVGMPPGGIM